MSSPDGYCHNLLTVLPGDHLPAGTCDQCGHAQLAHIGVDHCPVCELVGAAEQQRDAAGSPLRVYFTDGTKHEIRADAFYEDGPDTVFALDGHRPLTIETARIQAMADAGGYLTAEERAEQARTGLRDVTIGQELRWPLAEVQATPHHVRDWIANILASDSIDAKLRDGRTTLNRVRESSDKPEAETLPEIGEIVHQWRRSGNIGGCVPMRVVRRETEEGFLPVLALKRLTPNVLPSEPMQYITRTHDETRTQPSSWHWPCGGDDLDAVPESDAPGPVSVTINVSGSVLSDRDLRDVIKRHLRDLGRLNPTTFRR